MTFSVPVGAVLVSDGGLATELEARGHDLSDDLWSARLLVDGPQQIAAVHSAYFDAGAEVATTATYQASFDGFAERGIDRPRAAALMRLGVTLAREARDAHGSGWVAASIGPYGAALANGEEYRGRYGLTVAELTAWHRPRMEVIADAGPDLFAIETVPDLDEAEAVAAVVAELGVPAWLSFTVDGTVTRAGQPLSEAFAVAAGVDEIVAVGVNCCAPGDVLPAITIAREVTGKPVVVYPNSGEVWDGARRVWTGTSSWVPGLVPRWVAAGARIVGGCCRVSPSDITRIAADVR
ncbi:homocysteine S-methyltransferase [Mycolicibacterium parafortuitum]|uniref:Homocysteine methyltransferase [Saccharomonospora viridis DSM] n=1 Tax=Mycolicibacterium parafortuitum TaxID=39692 RepID=A0A375YPN1_MYCPF|nr:homocysteine S-methyltransferase [Mycolicibacterium parafortuitum]ORB29745.1 homocysteine S-methyltransferase [Mycolicibacterium parafortuitum]SRX83060.1 homocysteine methyltransferase [Saccharomonospora viridis DSM] [Mycolicibacterium parafortuitum]